MQVKTPKVSVCVVTYNHEKYIRQCLQSIVDQKTDFDFEVIVGDDCSTDGTRAIVKEFASKYPDIVKPIFHEKNIGACRNYLCVHKSARGEYIAHVDGDDYWYADKLQSQINFMECNKNCSAVYTNAWVVTDSGKIIGVFSSGVKSFFDISYLIQQGNFLTNSSTLYRTKFRELILPASGEFIDFLLHIRLAQFGQLGFIDKNLVAYTYQSANSTILNNHSKARLLIWEALQDINLPKDKKQTIDKAKYAFISDAILFEILHGNRQHISNWVTLLANNSKQNTFRLNLKLVFPMFTIISNKILSRFRRAVSKGNKAHVFFYK
jgi:glycosyltransferase involved in cell wall biosynthesis